MYIFGTSDCSVIPESDYLFALKTFEGLSSHVKIEMLPKLDTSWWKMKLKQIGISHTFLSLCGISNASQFDRVDHELKIYTWFSISNFGTKADSDAWLIVQAEVLGTYPHGTASFY